MYGWTGRILKIDLKKMIVVVQFQLQFNDEPSGKVWPAWQASAHYYLKLDENKDLKIKKIKYFTERHDPEDAAGLMEIWHRYREEALKNAGK